MKVYVDLEKMNIVCRQLKKLYVSLQDESGRLNRVVQYGFTDLEGKEFQKLKERIEEEKIKVGKYVRILEKFVRSLEKIIQSYQECEKDAEHLIEARSRVICPVEQVQYTDLRNVQKILKKWNM